MVISIEMENHFSSPQRAKCWWKDSISIYYENKTNVFYLNCKTNAIYIWRKFGLDVDVTITSTFSLIERVRAKSINLMNIFNSSIHSVLYTVIFVRKMMQDKKKKKRYEMNRHACECICVSIAIERWRKKNYGIKWNKHRKCINWNGIFLWARNLLAFYLIHSLNIPFDLFKSFPKK